MSNIQYNNKFSHSNVYGHVIDLIKKHSTAANGLHLDIGAGFGAIAESIEVHGLKYIGVDIGEEGGLSLKQRGFNYVNIDLLNIDECYSKLTNLVGSGKVSSISIIDTLEHLTNGFDVLTILHKIAARYNSLLIVSVPNTTHRDITNKLINGRLDYTYTGLLDSTHVFLYTDSLLKKMTENSGWTQVYEYDVLTQNSDQHFPRDNLFLAESPLFMQAINRVKQLSDPFYSTYQLVRGFLPKNIDEYKLDFQYTEPQNKVFLSIIIRTQGKRSSTLRDVFLCMAAQSLQDFELIIVAHKVSIEEQIKIEAIIEDQLEIIKDKTRLILINDVSGRAAPLNKALKYVKGQYISVLDDDDLVFANWVENYYLLSMNNYGKILRAVTVDQDIEVVDIDSSFDIIQFKTTSGIKKIYPNIFNLLDSLIVNSTPFMSWAFPRGLFGELKFQFDESLHVCEDWDLAIRAILLCGYKDGPSITSIYRKWKNGSCSLTLHDQDIWRSDYNKIQSKFSDQTQLISPEVMKQIINMRLDLGTINNKYQSLNNDYQALNNEYQNIIHSNSWVITKPFRMFGKIARSVKNRIFKKQ